MGKSILALFLFLSIVFACRNVSKNDSKVTSDTTKMIEIAVRTALNRRYMPSSQDLFYQYHYKDSILFCSDSLASYFLPLSVDSFKFKILSEREIMAMLKKDSAIKMLPNYLVLSCFEKLGIILP